MNESLSDEAASMHDTDLCSQGDSMCSGEADSQEFSQDDSSLYTLEEINAFLDDTFGKQVNVIDFFPDIEKFEKSVSEHQKNVSLEILSEKKRFRLKKHVTAIRKYRNVEKKRTLKVLF